jgi:DNA-binding NarL/FixJ family response regulator
VRDPGVTGALIVDDQQLVRAGLRRILAEGGVEVAGECEDGAAALRAVEALRPDVVLMDMRMRGMGGAEATRQIRALPGGPPVLVLTTYDDDETLEAGLSAGAAGFLLKDAPGEEIIRATRVVAGGGAWLDPAVADRVLRGYRAAGGGRDAGGTGLEGLTPRELEVLKLIARGLTNDEIAGTLFVGEATVKTHVNRVFAKLGLRDRAQAIVFAYRRGLA